jgi:CBS domain-containing protein
MGYTVITGILDGAYSNPAVAILAIGKAVALVFSLGAGTSGGLLAPMLLVGAGIGVGYGRVLNGVIPGIGLSPSMCGILFAFELTGNSHTIVPLMIGCMAADLTTRALMRESVMTERLVRRGLRISQDLEINHLATLSVRAVMSAPVAALNASMSVADALRLLAGAPGRPISASTPASTPAAVGVAAPTNADRTDPASPAGIASNGAKAESRIDAIADVTADVGGDPHDSGGSGPSAPRQQWTFPVVDDAGALVGIVTRGNLLDAAADAHRLTQPVSAIAVRDPQVAAPDESLADALEKLIAGDFALLPVISEDGSRRIIGAFTRGDAVRARKVIEDQASRRMRFIGQRGATERAGE